jgi:hypothetical protein
MGAPVDGLAVIVIRICNYLILIINLFLLYYLVVVVQMELRSAYTSVFLPLLLFFCLYFCRQAVFPLYVQFSLKSDAVKSYSVDIWILFCVYMDHNSVKKYHRQECFERTLSARLPG